MPRFLQKEDGFHFTLEDGSGALLLELDWENEPGTGADMWTPASDASGASWTKVDGGENVWTEEDGS